VIAGACPLMFGKTATSGTGVCAGSSMSQEDCRGSRPGCDAPTLRRRIYPSQNISPSPTITTSPPIRRPVIASPS
jgi:hypothetical protein